MKFYTVKKVFFLSLESLMYGSHPDVSPVTFDPPLLPPDVLLTTPCWFQLVHSET